MEVIEAPASFRKACDDARMSGRGVGFVPTMGFLHEGHLSLVRRARAETEVAAVSIFVNPLQFGPAEDLATYPRDLERDLAALRTEGADLVFAPGEADMYPDGRPEVTVDPGPLGDVLEGASRPGHFRGVCTVVAKLLSLAGPCTAYFGEKDAQQLAVIRAMVGDLDLPVEVMGCPTVREPDGLALSSRNAYLSGQERAAAVCLYRALSRAVELVRAGEPEAGRVVAEMRKVVLGEPLARLDYAAVVEEGTFREVDRIEPAGEWRFTVAGSSEEHRPLSHARALVAARIGATRLIDNMPLP